MGQPEETSIHLNGEGHQHCYQLVFYEGEPRSHVHRYYGETSFDAGHDHRLSGVTGSAPSGVQHVHQYKGTTTFDDGHVHHFAGETGPAVPLPGGDHYHVIEGETTVDAGPGGPPHSHRYHGTAR